MAKYIDADKLIHDLEERIYAYSEGYAGGDNYRKDAIETLLKDVRYQCSLQQEQQEVDLEKEINKWLDGPSTDLRTMARHFAEWQREQMLKDAFMSNYVVHDGRIELEGDPLPSLDPLLLLPYPQFKPGDKVRIVVLKEEEDER